MLRRTSLAAAVVVAATIAGAPSSQSRGVCHGKKYTMHHLIAYGKQVLPVPTPGQDRALRRMSHCMEAWRRPLARRWIARNRLQLGGHYSVSSTAYSSCDSGSVTAAGTGTYFGEVANNFLPLYTRIYTDRPVHGRRLFIVLDRIGSGSELDFFMPCGWVNDWGRRQIGFRVVR